MLNAATSRTATRIPNQIFFKHFIVDIVATRCKCPALIEMACRYALQKLILCRLISYAFVARQGEENDKKNTTYDKMETRNKRPNDGKPKD